MDVFFIDATTGWAVGMDGTILNTTNGGTDWVPQNSGGTDWLECVYFKNLNVGFVGGSEGILQTTNGGTIWTFNDVGSGWIDDIVFLDSLNGFAVGASGGTLSKGIDGSGSIDISSGNAKTWKTSDGGATWAEEVSLSGWLLRGCFTDRNSGWGVSTYGRIMKYTDSFPLPAPPSNLTAAAISRTEIRLTWADSATNENGFHLYRSDSISGAFCLIATLDANTIIYTDTALIEGITYWYRINAFNTAGNSAVSLDAFATAGIIVSVKQEHDIPTGFALEQNYPNPFNPTTTIEFSVPHVSFTSLKIYDVLGEEVATLVSENLQAGNHKADWNASNFSSGVYFYRLSTENFVATKKLLLLK